MDNYKELSNHIRNVVGTSPLAISQGIVKSVAELTCEVKIGNITIPDVRLRASELGDSGHLLIKPKVGTAVIVGSLSGDLNQLVVLAIDHAEEIIINGGKLGGLINIEQLTAKLNTLVDTFNNHIHQGVSGPTLPTTNRATKFSKADYEDTKVKH